MSAADKKKSAIHSLHGKKASARKARDSLAGKGGKSSQEVLTPPKILEPIASVWPRGITLDPCAPRDHSKRVVPARAFFDGFDLDGLAEDWFGNVFCNPPFDNLRVWRAKALKERKVRGVEVIFLGPVRPHRKWTKFEEWDRVCLLYPFAFVGFKQAFPEPCMATYLGDSPGKFSAAFSSLGHVGRWHPDDPSQTELF